MIEHHLPHLIVEDEGSDLTQAVRLSQGELPPRHVRYVRSFMAYNNAIAIGGSFIYHSLVGDVTSLAEFQELYFEDRAQFTLASRLWMTLLISTAILLVGLAGRHINPETGIFAALLLSINGFFNINATYALPDALVSFATALAIWLILRIWHYKRRRDYILAALSLAMVMLSKLQAAPIGLAFLVAHGLIVYHENEGFIGWKPYLKNYFFNKNLALAAAVGIIGNIIFNPLAFIHVDDLIFEIQRAGDMFYGSETEHIALSTRLSRMISEIELLIRTLWRWTAVATLMGFVVQIYQRKPAGWIIISSFLAIAITVLTARIAPLSQIYYWMPWIIPMVLIGGMGFAQIWQSAMQRGNLLLRVSVLAFMLLIVGLDFAHTVSLVELVRQPMTQDLAYDYIQQSIPEDARIITGDPLVYGVPLNRNERSINRVEELTGQRLQQWDYQLAHPDRLANTNTYDLYGPEVQAIVDTYDDLMTLIVEEQIQYYIVADFCSGPQDDPSSNSARAFPPITDAFSAGWTLLATFSPYASGTCEAPIATRIGIADPPYNALQQYPGPRIRIYQIQ